MIAVSDGHGSSSFCRSDRGSRLACSVALAVCADFAERTVTQDRDAAAQNLCQEIVTRWKEAVLTDYAGDPFQETELESVSEKYRALYQAGKRVEHAYGATLILALETAAGTLAIRCGDGECIAIDSRGNFSRPIPWNEKCDVNMTTSLCDLDALEEFRWVWLEEPPAAIWIGTDGLDNSYTVPEDLEEFYANLSVRALEGGCDPVLEELRQFLPVLTQRCSQDDISVAAMVNPAELERAGDRLRAYVELRSVLRQREAICRRLKVTARSLREKERQLARGTGSQETLCREITAIREEEAQLNSELSEQEAKLALLHPEAGIPTDHA